MSRIIPVRICVRDKGERTFQITPNWAGKGLAIHKPLFIDGDGEPGFSEERGVWYITHIHTGLRSGMFTGSLDRAKAFARQWDEAWAAVTSKSKVPAKLRKDYLAALAAANNGPSRKDLIEAGV